MHRTVSSILEDVVTDYGSNCCSNPDECECSMARATRIKCTKCRDTGYDGVCLKCCKCGKAPTVSGCPSIMPKKGYPRDEPLGHEGVHRRNANGYQWGFA